MTIDGLDYSDWELVSGSFVVHKHQAYIALITYFTLLVLPAFFWHRRKPSET